MVKSEDLHVFGKDLLFLFHWVALQAPLRQKRISASKNSTLMQMSPSNAEKRQNFTNKKKLYLRIPTSVDAIIITMQNGKYNAVLLTKIVLIDLTIYVLPL